MTRRLLLVAALLAPMGVLAQGTVAVRVLTDSGARPIAYAYVGIPMLQRAAITDSTGRAGLDRSGPEPLRRPTYPLRTRGRSAWRGRNANPRPAAR